MSQSATFSAYFDIYIGDEAEFGKSLAAYEATSELLARSANIYGLPNIPEELDEEQRGVIEEINNLDHPLVFTKPVPLNVGRLVFSLDPSPGLAKTRANFLSLCSGDRGMCKNAPNKPLHYLSCPIHRIVQGFVAQGGDVTRGDGSGGEVNRAFLNVYVQPAEASDILLPSQYTAKFNDEKDGLRKAIKKGSLAMANSGKNSNSSQWFVVLTDEESKLKKMAGKYVVFGELIQGWDVLDKLDAVGGKGGDGKPLERVWIGGCGAL
ncbi:hypothetical protein BOTBODRAFT_383856 [Botryobasidium botryosum FD-172 SS1]|uniref:Peptidyl-prolyl cis-trans isomerase n=1 Tax=Botryobasidium botryosum (strain FD-172 SS1) TaxID=930990 RepID=A0A067N791_BOTB1|nr:hypothetical protein BOTBODRAFT_383856 [Botryobasidium botryosum FD-172 SS1]